MNSRPFVAPGSVFDLIITTRSITNNAGIATVVNFSIPPATPPITIITFNTMNIAMNIIVDPEFVTKSVKYFAESALNIPSCVNIETKFALKYFMQYPPRVA